jgi:hypothetical protein
MEGMEKENNEDEHAPQREIAMVSSHEATHKPWILHFERPRLVRHTLAHAQHQLVPLGCFERVVFSVGLSALYFALHASPRAQESPSTSPRMSPQPQ